MISSTSLVSPNALLRIPGLRRSSSARTHSFPQHFSSPRCAAAAASASRSATPAAAPTTASATLYDVLGVAAGASGGEIKAAYRRLARECHPDAVAAGRKGASASEFIRVHAAYATLSDPEKRAEYDRSVMMAAAAAALAASGAGQRWSSPGDAGRRPFYYSSGTSPVGRSRRTWETDQCW